MGDEYLAFRRRQAPHPIKDLAREDARSPTVTCVENTRALDIPRLIDEVRRRGFQIVAGYGPLKDATFRIGHMGDVTVEQTRELLAALDEAVGTPTT